MDAVVIGLRRQPTNRIDLRRAQKRIDSVVFSVEPHEVHIEPDHSLDPLRKFSEAAREVFRGHIGTVVIESFNGDARIEFVIPIA